MRRVAAMLAVTGSLLGCAIETRTVEPPPMTPEERFWDAQRDAHFRAHMELQNPDCDDDDDGRKHRK